MSEQGLNSEGGLAGLHAVRDSDISFRTLADALPHMIWSTLPDGFHDYYNARWYEFTGVRSGSTDGEGWNGMFHPDDQDRAKELWEACLASGEPYEIEYRLRHHSGDYRWTLGKAVAVRNSAGAIVRWMGTCTDIDETKRIAQQNELLSRELSHRIKNIFAVIAGLVSLSSRQQPGTEQFAANLKQRISALGRAHEFVRPHSDESRPAELPGSLHGILREILEPYPALEDGRIRIEGDDIRIDDRGATPIALVIHELATNAAKYGALSAPGGIVEIRTGTDDNLLTIKWSESGGAARSGHPERTGFGSKLMELSVVKQLGGRLERQWGEEGLEATIEVKRSTVAR